MQVWDKELIYFRKHGLLTRTIQLCIASVLVTAEFILNICLNLTLIKWGV